MSAGARSGGAVVEVVVDSTPIVDGDVGGEGGAVISVSRTTEVVGTAVEVVVSTVGCAVSSPSPPAIRPGTKVTSNQMAPKNSTATMNSRRANDESSRVNRP